MPDLAPLAEALEGTEWILHAASQDLPCLREIGLAPTRLFDTELAGRLLGHPRVGLSALLEQVLGFSLAKEHSAADWSTRPLPEPWLRYAALDVELLVELRDALEAELREAGKLEWALQEFDAARDAPPATPRVDPWRRTSGMHKIRRPRQLAVVRGLWYRATRSPAVATRRPGRVLPDSAIVAAAAAAVGAEPAPLSAIPAFHGRGARRHLDDWQSAVTSALALPETELPASSLPPTARRRRAPGPTATPTRRHGWRPHAPGSRRSPSSTTCRWRTWCPPTSSAGSPGRRRPADAGHVAQTLAAGGREAVAGGSGDPWAGDRAGGHRGGPARRRRRAGGRSS